jgi:hypothetical protein
MAALPFIDPACLRAEKAALQKLSAAYFDTTNPTRLQNRIGAMPENDFVMAGRTISDRDGKSR